MTPLAYRIVKELTLPKRERTFEGIHLPRRLSGAQCFEVTDIYDAAFEIAKDVAKVAGSETSSFLPAPKTWIERRNIDGSRFGWLLEEHEDDSGVVYCAEALDCRGQSFFGEFGADSTLSRGYLLHLRDGLLPMRDGDRAGYYMDGFAPENIIPALLAFINTPRIIGRRQHMPHRGLERKLIARRAVIGKFPLHAWTEIKLHVTPPKDVSGERSHEAHLTGERALHFCRAHLRIRLGKLEVVRGHWRGDPAIGIKQTRYTVVP